MKVRITFVMALVFLAAAAIAATPAKSKLHDLDPLGGKWACKGAFLGMEGMPKHDIAGNVSGEWALNNHWLAMHYWETKTKENPMPMEVRAYFTYDEGEKKFALGSVGNDGSYSVENSNGWEGDKMVFVGPNHMGGPAMNGRDTWAKKGANTVTYTFEIEEKGAWKKLIDETCTKQ